MKSADARGTAISGGAEDKPQFHGQLGGKPGAWTIFGEYQAHDQIDSWPEGPEDDVFQRVMRDGCQIDQPDTDPYAMLSAYHRDTRFDRMRRDAARYMPAIAAARYVDSLFEVKTVLVKNEGDDGRPILFERHPNLPGCYSILGGKIDNIYDVLEKLDQEPLPLGQVEPTRAEAHQP